MAVLAGQYGLVVKGGSGGRRCGLHQLLWPIDGEANTAAGIEQQRLLGRSGTPKTGILPDEANKSFVMNVASEKGAEDPTKINEIAGGSSQWCPIRTRGGPETQTCRR